MPFHFIDAILGGAALTVALIISAALAYVGYGLPVPDPGFRALGVAALFVGAVILATAIIGRLVHRAFPLSVGTFDLSRPGREANVWKLLGFLNLFNVSILINTSLCPVNLRWVIYQLVGTRIGSNVMIGGKIIEPLMVSIGDMVILGEDSLVLGHAISRGKVTLGRVDIGNGVTVGVKAIIMPNVHIGDGAVVWAGSVVPMGTRIGAGEDWAGLPARRVATRMKHSIRLGDSS